MLSQVPKVDTWNRPQVSKVRSNRNLVCQIDVFSKWPFLGIIIHVPISTISKRNNGGIKLKKKDCWLHIQLKSRNLNILHLTMSSDWIWQRSYIISISLVSVTVGLYHVMTGVFFSQHWNSLDIFCHLINLQWNFQKPCFHLSTIIFQSPTTLPRFVSSCKALMMKVCNK